MLWHIMKIYSHYGFNDFVICLGYKGYVIKKYFADYFLSMSDMRLDLKTNTVEYLNNTAEPWKVTLVDTGEKTLTGGRLRRVKDYLGDETFCMTYGDGVTNLDIPEVIKSHREHKGLATLTAMQRPGRYGAFTLHKGQTRIENFAEKPLGDGAWVNGGFFVLEPKVIDFIEGDLVTWEQEPMQVSPKRAIFSLSRTQVSGTQWTACATKWCWRKCGPRAMPHGKSGENSRFKRVARNTIDKFAADLGDGLTGHYKRVFPLCLRRCRTAAKAGETSVSLAFSLQENGVNSSG